MKQPTIGQQIRYKGFRLIISHIEVHPIEPTKYWATDEDGEEYEIDNIDNVEIM